MGVCHLAFEKKKKRILYMSSISNKMAARKLNYILISKYTYRTNTIVIISLRIELDNGNLQNI